MAYNMDLSLGKWETVKLLRGITLHSHKVQGRIGMSITIMECRTTLENLHAFDISTFIATASFPDFTLSRNQCLHRALLF